MLNHSHIYDKNGKSVHQKCIICKCIAVYSSCARNNMDFIHQDSSKWMYCYNFRINFCGHTIFIFFSIFFKCKKKENCQRFPCTQIKWIFMKWQACSSRIPVSLLNSIKFACLLLERKFEWIACIPFKNPICLLWFALN